MNQGYRTLKFGALVALTALVFTGCQTEPPTPSTPATVAERSGSTPAPTPMPTTVAGFEAMFDKVDVEEWGGGDVSVSVEIADGRTVWLYGDTVSREHWMVSSSALVQTGGELHVSNQGRQLLPKAKSVDGRRGVYWIETAKPAGGNEVQVTVAPMSIGTRGPWDFRRTSTTSRTATLAVDTIGDVRFVGWTGWVAEPKVNHAFLGLEQGVPAERYADKDAVFYRKNAHPQFRLASGQVLHTICANRTDGDLSDLAAYRPIFLEE